MKPRFKFRNPPLAMRVVVVAGFFATLGALAGLIGCLIWGHVRLTLIVSVLFGAFAGAFLEAGADMIHRHD